MRIEDLKLYFYARDGIVRAVDGANLTITPGRTLGVLGESGCGKSSLTKAILRLLPPNVARYSGRVLLHDHLDDTENPDREARSARSEPSGTPAGEQDLMQLDDETFRKQVRWQQIAFVPQAAMNSLNPVTRVVDQISEPLLEHRHAASRAAAAEQAAHAFDLVGIPRDFLLRYPFELSGGMRQRVVIAMALVTDPILIILDEPTSALDILTQAHIMNTLKEIKQRLGTTFMLITHDVATASEIAGDVAVMYAGQILEQSTAERFFAQPAHPYSSFLMSSVPTLRRAKTLQAIPGQPPSLVHPPAGCRFADRCPHRFSPCDNEPPLFGAGDARAAKCWLYETEQNEQSRTVTGESPHVE